VSSFPFFTIRIIQKLVDELSAYLKATKVIKSHLHDDDLLTGVEIIDETRVIRDKLIALLARGASPFDNGRLMTNA